MAKTNDTALPDFPPPDAIDALQKRIQALPERIRGRGIRYVAEGRVESLEWSASGARAVVLGSKRYRCEWSWRGARWTGACTCPMGMDCKHLYAAASELLRRTRQDTVEGNDETDLAVFRSAIQEWQRARALSRLLLRTRPELEPDIHLPPLPGLIGLADPDLRCWHVAGWLMRRANGWLPAPLEAFRDRPDIEARHRSLLEAILVENLGAWSRSTRPGRPTRSIRYALRVVRHPLRAPEIEVEARLTSARLQDEPRTPLQLRQLLSSERSASGSLPASQRAQLEVFLDVVDVGGGPWQLAYANERSNSVRMDQEGLLRFLAATPEDAPIVWHEASDPGDVRFGVRPGEPVRVGDFPVWIVPECELRQGHVTLDLFVRGREGRLASVVDALFVNGREEEDGPVAMLVLVAGVLHRVSNPPPLPLLQAARGLRGLPLERRHSALAATLARAFPSLRESLDGVAGRRSVAPLVAIDVRQDDWLQFRLFSLPAGFDWDPEKEVPAGAMIDEFTPRRVWSAIPSSDATSPDAPPDAGLEIADQTALDPAVEWIQSFGARDGAKAMPGGKIPVSADRDTGWWLSMGARNMAAFAEAWNARPEGVRWYATARARRMIDGDAAPRPRVRVHASGIDFFELSAEWELEGSRLSETDLALLAAGGGRFVRLSVGWVARGAGGDVERDAEALADLGLEPSQEPRRLTLWELAQARPGTLELLGDAASTARAEINELRSRVAGFAGLPQIAVPAQFRGTLREYQRRGLDFLAHAASLGLGAILADDMGLGKTVQALAWLLWLRERDPSAGPALVVCPASVIHNWEREAASFAPTLRVALAVRGRGRSEWIDRAGEFDLLITNYALLRADIERWKKTKLGAVILDEAQFIKNPDAAVSRAVLELDARHRLALTGTPLENRALDLWSILSFVQPGWLGPRRTFVARYDQAGTPLYRRRLLAARLRPLLLRRLKSEVARDLPPRIEERRDCELAPAQRRLYAAELVSARQEIDALAANADKLRKNRLLILARLTRLRQICCHPALVGGAAARGAASGGRAAGSGKFEALWELLEPLLAEGQKVLLFSQFVRCLELLRAEMTKRNIRHHILTGSTTRRGEVVQAFEQDPEPAVFLLSLRAGGTGLNLTSASYVVLFDPWWNPAVEAQAIDRTHRIGQTRTVIAYRMLVRGTIEEKIWELQGRKAALVKDVLGEEGFARALTRDDLAFLLESGPG